MVISNWNSYASKRPQRDSVKHMFDKQHDTPASPAEFLLDLKEILKVLGCEGGGGDPVCLAWWRRRGANELSVRRWLNGWCSSWADRLNQSSTRRRWRR